MPAGRRWPWRAGAVALAVLGLCAIGAFSLLVGFIWLTDALGGRSTGLEEWLVLGAFDVAALAFLAWGVSELWRRT